MKWEPREDKDIRPGDASGLRTANHDRRDNVLFGRSAQIMGAALAHELNQPLTALVFYLHSLKKQIDALKLDGEAPDLAGKAMREAERASEIIRKMRRTTAENEPERQPVKVNGLIRETIEATNGLLAHVASVETRLSDDLPDVHCDPVQIRQVLVNLLKNAAEALVGQEDGAILVETRMSAGQAEVVVSDNGPGIAPQIRDRLFKAFETTKSQGVGLGLAISRMIAQNHGGELGLVLRGNERGTSFCLRLPVRIISRSSGG